METKVTLRYQQPSRQWMGVFGLKPTSRVHSTVHPDRDEGGAELPLEAMEVPSNKIGFVQVPPAVLSGSLHER